jgi:hypothetical protein
MSRYTKAGEGNRLPTSDALGDFPALTAEQIHTAKLVVCERAADEADARSLLAVLGLGGVV